MLRRALEIVPRQGRLPEERVRRGARRGEGQRLAQRGLGAVQVPLEQPDLPQVDPTGGGLPRDRRQLHRRGEGGRRLVEPSGGLACGAPQVGPAVILGLELGRLGKAVRRGVVEAIGEIDLPEIPRRAEGAHLRDLRRHGRLQAGEVRRRGRREREESGSRDKKDVKDGKDRRRESSHFGASGLPVPRTSVV